MKTINISKGYSVIVDDDDFEEINKYKWKANGVDAYHVYACRNVFIPKNERMGTSKTKSLSMHRLIMKAKNGDVVDHINGNTLDNRKCNLRFCTISQNGMNRRIRASFSSKFKGVYFCKATQSWRACIQAGKNKNVLGYFEREIDAALAYNNGAKETFGEFAVLNDPELLKDAIVIKWEKKKYTGIPIRAKLNVDQVNEIILSKEKTRILAERYNVNKCTIIRIRKRKTWTNIEMLSQKIDVTSLA